MADTQSEFKSEGFVQDRYICYKSDAMQSIRNLLRRVRGRHGYSYRIRSRISTRSAKKLILSKKLAVTTNGAASWFYTAYDRGNQDPLTNYSLQYIENNISREARILVTGCGTGITAFHLADCGFREIVGIDLLPECITVAECIKEEYRYIQTSFYRDDCFHPKLQGSFDVITALHWVFSAWMGNYGNNPVETQKAKDPEVRVSLLTTLLATYAPHLNTNGLLIIELTDAVSDYRLASDHYLGDFSLNIYPVRHTPEQVQRCAMSNGLIVIDKKFCVSYGHHPRTTYILKKS